MRGSTLDGVHWYVFSAQPDYGFDQSIFEYQGDPSQAFKAVSDSVRHPPNPEDENNRLLRSVWVSSEGVIQAARPGTVPEPKIEVKEPDIPMPTIEIDLDPQN